MKYCKVLCKIVLHDEWDIIHLDLPVKVYIFVIFIHVLLSSFLHIMLKYTNYNLKNKFYMIFFSQSALSPPEKRKQFI